MSVALDGPRLIERPRDRSLAGRARRRLAAVATVAFLMSATASPGVAQTSADSVLLEDVGPGWSPTACPSTSGPTGAATACFVSDEGQPDGYLAMSAMPISPDIDARTIVEGSLAGAGEPFSTPGLAVAGGRAIGEAGQLSLIIAMVAGGYLFTLILATEAPRSQAEPWLLDVAKRQQDEAGGGPQPSAEAAPSDAALDRLLLTPPDGSGLEILVTGDSPVDIGDVGSQARSQAVVDLLNAAPSRTRILASNGTPVVIVTLWEQPYEVFAAAMLGVVARLPLGHPQLGSRGMPDAIGFRFAAADGGGWGIAFRKGRYLALLVTPYQTIDDASLDAMMLLARLQAEQLPEGGTAPYFFPSTASAIGVTVGLTTLVWAGALGLGVAAAARRRRRTRVARASAAAPASDPRVVDVTRKGTELRRRGLVLVVVDLVAVNAIVVGALGLTGVLQVPAALTAALLAFGTIGGVAFTVWWARSERRRDPAARSRELRPSIAGVAGGVLALALLVIGLGLLSSGLAGFAFGPSLRGLERSKRLGIDPRTLDLAILLAGAALLVLGGFVFRLARIWSKTSAERLRARDARPPILYLRSFEDDELRLPTFISARRPFFELFAARGSDPFEETIAWQVEPYGPVVAIGRPGRSLKSLGAARDHLPEDEWRQGVRERMAAARAIVVTLGTTEGLRWEMEQLAGGGHLGRTIFVFPPEPADVLSERWRFTSQTVIAPGHESELPAPVDRTLTAVADSTGAWRVSVGDVRDEATFRVGLDLAMAWCADVPWTLPAPPPPRPA